MWFLLAIDEGHQPSTIGAKSGCTTSDTSIYGLAEFTEQRGAVGARPDQTKRFLGAHIADPPMAS
jgi:hypothetical protein